MRTTKELLIIVSKNRKLFSMGLCHMVSNMRLDGIITNDEREVLRDYIWSNRPRNGWFVTKPNNLYYWTPGLWFPRYFWLKAQIKKQP